MNFDKFVECACAVKANVWRNMRKMSQAFLKKKMSATQNTMDYYIGISSFRYSLPTKKYSSVDNPNFLSPIGRSKWKCDKFQHAINGKRAIPFYDFWLANSNHRRKLKAHWNFDYFGFMEKSNCTVLLEISGKITTMMVYQFFAWWAS